MKRQKAESHPRTHYMLGLPLFLFLDLVATPAPEGSLTPYLASSEAGLHMTWLEATAKGHALRYSRWDGKEFTEPSTVHESNGFFANWADFPSVLPFGKGRLAAHWLEKAAAGTYEYDVFISISDDGGRTWSAGVKPHRDGTLSEHGFVSLAPEGEGFRALWLDGRNFEKTKEMALVSTRFEGKGFAEETLVDARVCECCQTGMAALDDGGFLAAYRDRSSEEIRDISYVRFQSGRWTEPRALNDDGWELAGCPVNGPQVAASGKRVAVAWFTASRDEPRVQVVFSVDGGKTFGNAIRVDAGSALGRVDVQLLNGDAVVTWLGRASERGEILARRISFAGEASEIVQVARTGVDRPSGFPRIASFRGSIYVAWTEWASRQGPSQVRLSKLTF